MTELLDKIIIRFFFILLTCLVLMAYRYAHGLFYTPSRSSTLRRFFPTNNASDTIHLFARILGVVIIFHNLTINMAYGIWWASFNFCCEGILVFFLYLGSIYIIEGISLYDFEYSAEITERKNFAYATVSGMQAIAVAIVLTSIFKAAQHSLTLLFILWPFSLVLLGITTKLFKYVSQLSFAKMIIQGKMAIALSYGGYIWGWSFLIAAAFRNNGSAIQWYAGHIILRLLLSTIIFPLIRQGLVMVFRIQNDYQPGSASDTPERELGQGIYEGLLCLASCIITAIITDNIEFDPFYDH